MAKNGLHWTEEQLAAHNRRMNQLHTQAGSLAGGVPPAVILPPVQARKMVATLDKACAQPSSLLALGRKKSGEMNKTEAAYARHLTALQRDGAVLWFKFEAITLKLAHDCRLTVDFAVLLADGTLEMHDVKGARAIYKDDAKVKMKVASELFPFRFVVVFPRKAKDGGGWDVEPVK